jgi:purine nucleosidase
MRRILIDTDTASDDAVAIILALREPSVKVEAITVVAGNVPLPFALKNALISVETAGSYIPPVFAGMSKPLLRDLFTAEFVHGEDGMGNMNLPEPILRVEKEHSVDALIRIIDANPGELELVTLGPLTNIAMVCLKSPETIRKLKRISIMGGCGLSSGNITQVAEYNIFADAEAANIVMHCGVPLFIIGWDVSMGAAFMEDADLDQLQDSGSDIARFCVRCNQSLYDFNLEHMNKRGFDLPDPAAMIAALFPETVLESYEAYVDVEFKAEKTYGQLLIDSMNILNKKPTATICKEMNGDLFKQILYDHLVG